MTKEQATAEMKYRLAKYILQVLLDADMITTEEAIQVKAALQKKRDRRLIQADVMSGFLFTITELDTLQLQFNPTLWHTTVDHVTVYADECLEFHFMNGIDVEVRI